MISCFVLAMFHITQLVIQKMFHLPISNLKPEKLEICRGVGTVGAAGAHAPAESGKEQLCTQGQKFFLCHSDMYRTAENKARFSYLYDLRSYLLFWTLTFFTHICRIPVILTDITKNSKEKRVAGDALGWRKNFSRPKCQKCAPADWACVRSLPGVVISAKM